MISEVHVFTFPISGQCYHLISVRVSSTTCNPLQFWHVIFRLNQLCIPNLLFSYPIIEFNISILILQPKLLLIPLSPANLNIAFHFILVNHNLVSILKWIQNQIFSSNNKIVVQTSMLLDVTNEI